MQHHQPGAGDDCSGRIVGSVSFLPSSSREPAGLAVVASPSPGRSRELAGNAVEAGRVQAQLLNQVNAQPERRRPPGA